MGLNASYIAVAADSGENKDEEYLYWTAAASGSAEKVAAFAIVIASVTR